MYKIFDTLSEYNQYTNNGTHLTAGILYLVKENKSLYFQTNNIDGETEKYEYLDEIPEGYIIPTGNISITENGENIDVNDYATATVAVPQPTGNISITENGENIDIAQYATASVNVDAPAKDYIVEGAVYDPTATYSGEFMPSKQIVTANIPSGFKSIGGGAFRNYKGLTSVTIPNSVTSIGSQAFEECSNLTSIVVDSGNTVFDSRDNCNAIIKTSTNELIAGCKTTVIPNTVTSIGTQAFYHCTGLTSITIPDSVTSIGDNVFNECTGLTSITIPDGVTSIGKYAFYQCSSFTSVTIGNGVTSIGDDAFRFCLGLTSVTVEATTPPTLGANAFNNTNDCPIYVPAESVDAYKAATNWSAYASRIQAIA